MVLKIASKSFLKNLYIPLGWSEQDHERRGHADYRGGVWLEHDLVLSHAVFAPLLRGFGLVQAIHSAQNEALKHR